MDEQTPTACQCTMCSIEDAGLAEQQGLDLSNGVHEVSKAIEPPVADDAYRVTAA